MERPMFDGIVNCKCANVFCLQQLHYGPHLEFSGSNSVFFRQRGRMYPKESKRLLESPTVSHKEIDAPKNILNNGKGPIGFDGWNPSGPKDSQYLFNNSLPVSEALQQSKRNNTIE